MTTSFELGPEFLLHEDIPLSADDLKYGFERGWVRRTTVIDCAIRRVKPGDDDEVLLDVASLLHDEVDRLPEVLARLDSSDHIHDPRDQSANGCTCN